MEFILYLLLIAAFIFSIYTSINVKGTFRKYNKMPSSRGMSAADIARQILDSNGLYNVQVTRVSGELTDHYDPRTNTVALSAPVYDRYLSELSELRLTRSVMRYSMPKTTRL